MSNKKLYDEMSISKFFIQERSEDYLEQIVDYLNNQKFKFNNIDIVFDPNTVLDGVRRLGSKREQHCFYLRCEGKTSEFIGKTFNVTEERINDILDNLKKKLEQNWKLYKTINIPVANIEKIFSLVDLIKENI